MVGSAVEVITSGTTIGTAGIIFKAGINAGLPSCARAVGQTLRRWRVSHFCIVPFNTSKVPNLPRSKVRRSPKVTVVESRNGSVEVLVVVPLSDVDRGPQRSAVNNTGPRCIGYANTHVCETHHIRTRTHRHKHIVLSRHITLSSNTKRFRCHIRRTVY